MIIILATLFFIFGLIIGSFLNVVILRYNTEATFGGRSACMNCQNSLRPYELIPVVSFFILKGRCSSCKTKIAIQYPLVELATGLIFAGLFWKFQDLFFLSAIPFAVTYAYYATIFALLVVIATYDLKHKIIPDKLSLVFGVVSFLSVFFFVNYNFLPHMPTFLGLISGVLVSLPFALIWFLSRGAWMGLGDAKLAIGLGYFLGFSSVLSAIVLAFWSGALIGVFLIVFSLRHKLKSEIPFAPFLVLGAILIFLFEINLFPIF